MTCKDTQIKELRKNVMTMTQTKAAIKTGIDRKTARTYLRSGKLPSELKKPHIWQTRKDPFTKDWAWIKEKIIDELGLEAKTLMEHLVQKEPGRYQMNQLRTLQRRFQYERAKAGPDKKVIFLQTYPPGQQAQVDFTSMAELKVSINGEHFKHLLFHFKLSCSKWEWGNICYGESFESLAKGIDNALFQLGGCPTEIRSDNLTAAWTSSKGERKPTENYQRLADHYGFKITHNNPGESHENGSIEKAHDIFKRAVKQALIMRGSSDFANLEDYQTFLIELFNKRNHNRLSLEAAFLKPVPSDKWTAPKTRLVRVRTTSCVEIEKVQYSVPSRLISLQLHAYVYQDKIELFYKNAFIQSMQKLPQGQVGIDYRHIIHSLLRKPGAFKQYQHRECLYPSLIFKKAYEACEKHSPTKGHKVYLNLLHLATMHGEERVQNILEQFLSKGTTIEIALVEKLLNEKKSTAVSLKIQNVSLWIYDQLVRASC